MCKFKNKFNGYNLTKEAGGRRRVRKLKKLDKDLVVPKTSAKSSSRQEEPFPHLQKSLMQEKVYNFYDRNEDYEETASTALRSADKDELIVVENSFKRVSEDDEDVMPKLTLWLV